MTKYEKYKLTILTVFSFLVLLLFWNYSPSGRYIIEGGVILDSKTGRVYIPEDRKYINLEDFSNQKDK